MRKYRFFYTSAKGLLKSGYSDYFDVEAKSFKLAFKKYKALLDSLGDCYASMWYYKCNELIRKMNKSYLAQIKVTYV